MSNIASLPRWDMTPYFPGLESAEFSTEFASVESEIKTLAESFDQGGVGTESKAVSDTSVDSVLTAYNRISARYETLSSYVYAFLSTDSRDDRTLARSSEVDQLGVEIQKLYKRLVDWLGHADVDAELAKSELARNHEFLLRRSKVAASHLLPPVQEALVSDFENTGSTAWSKLHANLTSQLSVRVELPEGSESMPMSMVRAISSDPDRTKRKAAYHAELKAWKEVEVPLAACLNSIKGEALMVANRRGWGEPLEASLFSANIDRPTLDAMLGAAKESFPMFRRYLRAKAKAIGVPKLAFYDLFAPIGSETKKWRYDEACDFVAQQFDQYSPRMGEFARRNFRENWIDVEPREGKVDGAFCMGVRGDESRILLNFRPSFGAVSTLAHELGHGYHNLNLGSKTSLQRHTPNTLAETASIFCETIIRKASQEQGSAAEQFSILEAALQGSCQVVVDITSRYLFESSVYRQRAARELSPSEFCETMLEAQRQTYGDGLDADELHGYMWAAKPHYYSSESYYNYPYMFGLLFALGLYAVYQEEGESFKGRYDELLSMTGQADAATLASRFGIDIRSMDFWRASLRQIEEDVDRFEKLVG